jgi:hypothetical protein
MPRPPKPQYVTSLPADAIEHYATRAYDYVRDMFFDGDNLITSQQKDGLDAISIYPKVLISSGKGTGKTALFSWVPSWFLDTRPAKCRVPITAPTERGIQKTLWPEIHMWTKKSKVADHFIWQAESYRHRSDPINKFASYQASKEAENIRGQHAEHLLYEVDECFGVLNREVWSEIEFSMTDISGDNKLLAGGNYTIVEGWAHEQFTRNKHLWQPPEGILLNWNAEDSPIANKKHIFDMKARWGRDSDIYRSLVRGLPPLGNPMSFIRLSDLNEAIGREVTLEGAIELGVDPSRFGDDLTCIASRYGYTMFPLLHCGKTSEIDIYNMVINTVQQLRGKFGYNGRIKVKILVTGGLGSGCYDLLKKDTENNIEAIAIYETSTDDPLYADVMTVMWAEFRDMLPRLCLPDDVDLTGELSTRQFDIVLRTNKTRLEPKKEFKRRLGHSPDRSDAVVTCFSTKGARKKKLDFYPSAYIFPVRQNIHWEELQRGTIPLVSIWTDDTLQTAVLISLWNSQMGVLSVVAERIYDTPAPEIVLPSLDGIIKHLSNGFTSRSKFEFFGNKVFFSESGGDMRLAYSRMGQNVRKNMNYNEMGALLFVSALMSKGKLVIDKELGSLPYQLNEWSAEDDEDDPRFCLCRSLLLIGVCLQETGMAKPQQKTSLPYTEKRMKSHEEIGRLAEIDKLGEINGAGYGKPAEKDSWYFI